MTAAFFLEILNGGAVTPELMWLVLLSVYLFKEARRRGLHGFDWFHLPPSMNLIVAIFVVDSGVFLRSVTIWFWRRNGSPPEFTPPEALLLILGGGMIVLGYLCKFKALTKPDHGDIPWLVAGCVSIFAILVLLLV